MGATTVLQVQVGGVCCHITCPNDTSFCFNVPDSLIKLNKPTYTSSSPNAGGTGPELIVCMIRCGIMHPGLSCRNYCGEMVCACIERTDWFLYNECSAQSTFTFTIKFGTSPPIVGGWSTFAMDNPLLSLTVQSGPAGGCGILGMDIIPATRFILNLRATILREPITIHLLCMTRAGHRTIPFMVVVDSASGPDIYCISVVCPGDTVTYHKFQLHKL